MKRKIAFVGTGIIGSGLAVNAIMHGEDVYMYYRRNYEKLESSVKKIFSVFVENEICSTKEAEDWFNAIHFTMDLQEAVSGAVLVQESIAEKLDMKQEMYRTIQKICGDTVIIASSTSAMFPSALSAGALYPDKIIVGHPYNPSYLLPLMEVCGGETASPKTIEAVCQIYRDWEKEPVICKKEIRGFVVNRLSIAAAEAAKECIREGVCSVEDIDKAIMYGPGMRMAVTGQMLTLSLGIEGGLRKMAEKYGLPASEWDEVYACGVEEEMAHRRAGTGNTEEEICRFRDHMFVEILKNQGFYK